jgi:hypothetical protein
MNLENGIDDDASDDDDDDSDCDDDYNYSHDEILSHDNDGTGEAVVDKAAE